MRVIILFSVIFFIGRVFAQEELAKKLDEIRAQLVVKAFNQRPQDLIAPLTLDSVKIVNGVGRADVNKKAKFSYYIQTENSLDPKSVIYLIPMATSRFTPTYYMTDEWWDRHKGKNPMPRQPEEEVAAWLKEMKLSSNPNVLIIYPEAGKVERIPLQKYLLDIYLTRYAVNGKITVYRGAERENETQNWENKIRPKGVRYWTPTANYAWRYARKNLSLIEDLVLGDAPLLKFEIPVADFRRMADRQYPHLTLGTELTKNAHMSFDMYGKFQDHLAADSDFLGEGRFGVEFEIRGNQAGANAMVNYYKDTISIEEMAQDRIQVIRAATERLKKQRPWEKAELEQKANLRVARIQDEARILLLLKNKGSADEIRTLQKKLAGVGELTYIDGFDFQRFINEQLEKGGFTGKYEVESTIRKSLHSLRTCEAIYL